MLAELKRRKVVRVAIVYGIVAIAVIEASDVLTEALSIDEAFVTFVTVTALLGYPIAIVLAWAYEIVPDSVSQQITAGANSDVARREINKAHATLFRAFMMVGLIAIGIVIVIQYRGSLDAEAAPKIYTHSIAVMSLANFTGDDSLDDIGDGTAYEIISKLQRIDPLRVIDYPSLQAAGINELSVSEIANKFDVRNVLSGAIRFDETGRLRADAQIFTASGDLLDSGDFRAGSTSIERDQVADFQVNIAGEVVNMVLDTLPGLPRPAIEAPMEFGAGHRAFVVGREALAMRTADGIRTAIQQFERAISLDRNSAAAYASLAQAYALALFYRYDVGIDEFELAARSLAMSEHSLVLDPNLPEGYAARGYLGALTGNDPLIVAADFSRAMDLQPNSSSIPSWAARSLALLGDFNEAIREAERAIDLSPGSAARRIALAELLLQIGRYDAAIVAAREATNLEPGQYRSRAIEARSLLLSGRAAECSNMFLGPHRALTATCLYADGQETASADLIRVVIDDLNRGVRNEIEQDYSSVTAIEDLAIHFAWLDNGAEAARWAESAFLQSPAGIEVRNFESELFDNVRSRNEFESIIHPLRAGIYAEVVRRSREFTL